MHPLERQLNLVALLLESRRPLTFDDIRATLTGAYDQGERETAKRQFERDKDDLRHIGIPIDVVPTDALEVEEGYTIAKERYALPDISFTPDEVAALFVAASAPGDEGQAARAFTKLAQGTDAAALSSLVDRPAAAGIDVSGPHLEAVSEAVARRRRVRFRYRPATGRAAQREVDAWGLLARRGTWYLVGNDRKRGQARAFRLDRIASPVTDVGPADPPPEGFSAAEHVAAGPWGLGEPDIVARVALGPKVGWWAVSEFPESKILHTRKDGWIEAEVPAREGEAFASWILSLGPDAEVLGPESLRRAVVARLEALRASL